MYTFDLIIAYGIPLVLILIALTAGRFTQGRHLRSLAARESANADMFVTEIKTFPGGAAAGAVLVHAEVVIATDYLKTLLANIRKIFGGELRSYQTLMLRARREALLRLQEQARQMNLDAVCNVRLETADVGGILGRGTTTVAIVASGTAYRRPAQGHHGSAA